MQEDNSRIRHEEWDSQPLRWPFIPHRESKDSYNPSCTCQSDYGNFNQDLALLPKKNEDLALLFFPDFLQDWGKPPPNFLKCLAEKRPLRENSEATLQKLLRFSVGFLTYFQASLGLFVQRIYMSPSMKFSDTSSAEEFNISTVNIRLSAKGWKCMSWSDLQPNWSYSTW